jgi:hypothetical protein
MVARIILVVTVLLLAASQTEADLHVSNEVSSGVAQDLPLPAADGTFDSFVANTVEKCQQLFDAALIFGTGSYRAGIQHLGHSHGSQIIVPRQLEAVTGRRRSSVARVRRRWRCDARRCRFPPLSTVPLPISLTAWSGR